MFLFTLWAALTLNFFIPRFMPGNPLQYLVAKSRGKISPQAMADMLASFGYKQNANWADQYFSYIGDMLTGNWGVSLTVSPGASIRSMIFAALPWTLGLIGLTTILAFFPMLFISIAYAATAPDGSPEFEQLLATREQPARRADRGAGHAQPAGRVAVR